MKSLLTIILLCAASFGARAQATSLNVVNNTSCTVYYIIRGNSSPSCSPVIASVFIALAPFGSVSYSNAAALPGGTFSPTDNINGANLYAGTSSCGTIVAANVGEFCSGYGLSGSYLGLNSTCGFCRTANIIAVWTPATAASRMATLTFN